MPTGGNTRRRFFLAPLDPDQSGDGRLGDHHLWFGEAKEELAMNDIELRQFVLDELEFEPSIDAADIGVAAENGVITLTGHVPSYAQKMAAERAAWRVKGVKAIAQKIEVRLPGDKKVNDDEIAERALNILAWASSGLRDNVKVRVANGWVTLTGKVQWHYQRAAAESEVRKLNGVIGVTNSIELSPEVQASDIRQRILDALKRHAEVEASHIRIDVRDGGAVKIEGEVDNWDERQAVERAVWSAPGVRTVDDRVRIS
jgi:osmotically-inducible protein OsmY